MSRSAGFLRSIASSWLTLLIVTCTQLFQIPFALHHLGEQEFGLYAVLSQTLGMLLLAELGVSLAFARLLIDARIEGPEKYARMWCSGLALFLLQAAVIGTVALTVAPFLSTIFHLPPPLATRATWLFLAAGAISVVQYPLNIFSLALFAGQRVATNNVVSAGTTLLQFAVFVAAIYAGCGLWAYIIGLTASMAVGAFWQRRACRKCGLAVRFEWHLVDRSLIRSIFRLGMDVFFMGAYNLLMNGGPLLLSGILFPLEVSGRLAVNLKVSQMVIQILHRVPSSTEPALMELVSQRNQDRFRFAWTCMAKGTLLSAVAAGGCIYFFGGTLVRWWTSPAMVLSTSAIALVALLPLQSMIQHLFVSALVMFKQIGKVRWNLMLEAMLFATLALLLGSRYGVEGLLAAKLISLPLGALLPAIRHFGAEAGFERGFLGRLLLRFAVGPLLFFLALRAVLPGGTPSLSPQVIVAAIAWLGFAAAWGWFGLSAAELIYFRQMAARLVGRFQRA